MRTMYEIVEDAKDGLKPTYEECYYTMLMLDALWTFDRNVVLRSGESGPGKLKLDADLSFGRCKAALHVTPTHWLGDNVPENEEYQRRRKVAKALLDRVIAQEQDK